MTRIFFQCISILALSFIVACGNADAPADYRNDNIANHNANPKSVQEAFSVTTRELCADFTNSDVNAIHKYQDNLVNISGLVHLTNTTADDCRFISLGCTNDPTDEMNLVIQVCMEATEDLATFKAGDQITVQARYQDRIDNVLRFEEGRVLRN